METARVAGNNTVQFTINRIQYSVSDDSELNNTSLLVYIREYVGLRGTKAMCHEGDCGACIVSVTSKGKTIAVNSCLVPILICDRWDILTIEGLGNKRNGYHTIQTLLAKKNGSQCGYCSPGMVMNMYSILQNSHLSMQEIENSFGGNICRCTGYRAILDAFKTYGTDAPPSMVKEIHDIEELYKIKPCQKYGMLRISSCDKQSSDRNTMLSIKLKDRGYFYKVFTVEDLFNIFENNPRATYILYGGNTAHGVYPTSKKDIYIDINNIPNLRNIEKTDFILVLGGNLTLTMAQQAFKKYSTEIGFEYLRQLAEYVEMIANDSVRNIGTIAGNLMIKNEHNEFPSDLYLILETVSTQVHILESPSQKKSFYMWEFLKLDMHHKIIYSIVLPKLTNQHICRFYKIMPRTQNAKAHVNAGFLFKLDSDGTVLELPNIIIGGINKQFLHAKKTEEFLVGKSIIKNLFSTLLNALNTLHAELQPDHVLPDYSPEFRKILAEGLFYKFLLSIKPENIKAFYRSGGTLLERRLSSGKQDFNTHEDMWPVTKPIPKLESLEQTSGEAQYCDDLPPFSGEVFCAFVVTNISSGQIIRIDPIEAAKLKGFIGFFVAKDIPGKNLCISAASKFKSLPEDELLFAEKKVLYAGQPVGVIVAETHNLANEAAKLVKIIYERKTKPAIRIKDALDAQDDFRIMQSVNILAQKKGNNTQRVIKGSFRCGSQYHYSIETQSCVCVPVEGGMDVYPSSQWRDLIQVSIGNCLDVQNNSINVHVRRVGGSYGSKISRNAQISCACALVCHKLNRPARFVMTMESNMQSIGKRCSTSQDFEVGINDGGVIQYLNTTFWSVCGSSFNEKQAEMIISCMLRSCYLTDTWTFNGHDVQSNLPSNTFCRVPGLTEGVAMIENIMDYITKVTDQDPIEVRLANMNNVDRSVLETMIKDLSKQANYYENKKSIDDFNIQNRWKKKGIAIVPMKYLITYEGQFDAMVSICARDGSVCVTHSGIEIDQGINTKIAQVAAHTLGIDIELISIKQSNNLTAPNESTTGHSITTETCGYATIQACTQILNKLEPIRKKMQNPTWKDLVFKAYEEDVDLWARYMLVTGPTKDTMKPYPVYGVTIAEVEIDVLTGQHVIRRVDLMIDAGRSLNPMIDIGQIEGAFVMGIGYWTSEDLVYDDKGVLTNYRSWNYKPPGAKDIPEDFRIYLCKNSVNVNGIYGSKTIDEAPLCMSFVIPLAIRYALDSARRQASNTDKWYELDGPYTTERILLNSLTNKDKMTI